MMVSLVLWRIGAKNNWHLWQLLRLQNKQNVDREEGMDKRHGKTLALERECMESAEQLGVGFIGALAGIGDGLRSLALALNPQRE